MAADQAVLLLAAALRRVEADAAGAMAVADLA